MVDGWCKDRVAHRVWCMIECRGCIEQAGRAVHGGILVEVARPWLFAFRWSAKVDAQYRSTGKGFAGDYRKPSSRSNRNSAHGEVLVL